MLSRSGYVKILIGRIVIVNPLGAMPIVNRLTATGINIFTRTMGLFLAAIAMEFIANGLKGLFPALHG